MSIGDAGCVTFLGTFLVMLCAIPWTGTSSKPTWADRVLDGCLYGYAISVLLILYGLVALGG